MKIIKKKGNYIEAFQLGDKCELYEMLKKQNLVYQLDEELYSVFSTETLNGSGELARRGDYIKIDNRGNPYPNSRQFFEANHRKVEKFLYEQIPIILDAWSIEEQKTEEILFLLENKILIINEDSEQKYFNADLWGARLSAAKDAVVVFYKVEREENNQIKTIDFNFVAWEEFERTYSIVED
jgi:hypothetical protein